MQVRTMSGTQYEFRKGDVHDEVRRLGGDSMRRDGDWIKVVHYEYPEVGRPMVLILEGLGTLPYTERTTTPVVEVKEETE